MVIYPYDLYVFVDSDSVFNQETGEFSSTDGEWVFKSKCRDENGNGRSVKGEDGETFVYNSLIQLPQGVQGINSGDRIMVKDGDFVRFEGHVSKFTKDRLHSRIWV